MLGQSGKEEVDMRKAAITRWVLFAIASMAFGLNSAVLVESPRAKDQPRKRMQSVN